jgi:hypothetical protein
MIHCLSSLSNLHINIRTVNYYSCKTHIHALDCHYNIIVSTLSVTVVHKD